MTVTWYNNIRSVIHSLIFAAVESLETPACVWLNVFIHAHLCSDS